MPDGVSKAHKTVWLDEAHRPFDEQRIKVDVAAPQQGIVTRISDDLAQFAIGASAWHRRIHLPTARLACGVP